MLESIISLYAPHECIGCQTEGTLLCRQCTAGLARAAGRCYRCRMLSPSGRTCPSCRRDSKLYAVQAATSYEGLGKELIGRLKFGGTRAAAKAIAKQLEQFIPSNNVIIVHLPTASSRIRRRGYDQAALIARALAKQSRSAYLPALLRLGQQRQLGASRRERLTQLQDSFWVRHAGSVSGQHILLIDDVMTTGASLEAAAAALKLAGAKRVQALVFARA